MKDTEFRLRVQQYIASLQDHAPTGFNFNLRKFPVALNLYLKMCRENDREILENLVDQEDDHAAMAKIKVCPRRLVGCLSDVMTAREEQAANASMIYGSSLRLMMFYDVPDRWKMRKQHINGNRSWLS